MLDRSRFDFSGRVVRLEPDGFCLIRFDAPSGPSANTVGLISSSTGTIVSSGAGYRLSPGAKVVGTAEPDPHEVATIKTLKLVSEP